MQRCRGAEVQGCRGAEVERNRGAEVQRCKGADVQRNTGAEVERWRGGEVEADLGIVPRPLPGILWPHPHRHLQDVTSPNTSTVVRR